MSTFFIANVKIKNNANYLKYLEKVDAVFSKFNGKYLTVNKNLKILEGQWDYSLFVLIEFPDKCSFKNWYYSNEYQEILKLRLSGADCNTIIVE